MRGFYGILLPLKGFNTPTQGWGVLIQSTNKERGIAINANQTGVLYTTCEEVVEMYGTHNPYAQVIGKFICHDGNAVWLELAGCGASDSHTFTHKNNFFGYLNEIYKGKIVRLMGERSWDYREQMWGYRWTLHAVNVSDDMVVVVVPTAS